MHPVSSDVQTVLPNHIWAAQVENSFISDRHLCFSLVFVGIGVVRKYITACLWAGRRYGKLLKASSDPFLTFSIFRAVQVIPFPVSCVTLRHARHDFVTILHFFYTVNFMTACSLPSGLAATVAATATTTTTTNTTTTTTTSTTTKKAIPLQAWTGPEGSRRLRLPDFKTIGT